ncbi:hypothetical protein [Kitasatospora aureofaciens]
MTVLGAPPALAAPAPAAPDAAGAVVADGCSSVRPAGPWSTDGCSRAG